MRTSWSWRSSALEHTCCSGPCRAAQVPKVMVVLGGALLRPSMHPSRVCQMPGSPHSALRRAICGVCTDVCRQVPLLDVLMCNHMCLNCCCHCQHAGLPCLSVTGLHCVIVQTTLLCLASVALLQLLTSCTVLCAVLLPGCDWLHDSVLRVTCAGSPAAAAPTSRLSGRRPWRLL